MQLTGVSPQNQRKHRGPSDFGSASQKRRSTEEVEDAWEDEDETLEDADERLEAFALRPKYRSGFSSHWRTIFAVFLRPTTTLTTMFLLSSSSLLISRQRYVPQSDKDADRLAKTIEATFSSWAGWAEVE